ncbi:MAG: hypothetical protein AAGA58_10400, partial [Verrucomicrobiota bacterium]
LRALEEKLPARFSQSGTMRMLFEHLQAWKAVPDSISREEQQVAEEISEQLLALNAEFSEKLVTLEDKSSVRLDRIVVAAKAAAELADKALTLRERGSNRFPEARGEFLSSWREFNAEADQIAESFGGPPGSDGTQPATRGGGPSRL